MRSADAEYAFSKSELQVLRELTKGKQALAEIKKTLSADKYAVNLKAFDAGADMMK